VHTILEFYEQRYGRLPARIRLQLDNTAKDNKNYVLLGYMATLIQLGLIEHAELHYLLVGHTHNDVDGVFGR
jgi:hypothetical protein